MNFIKRHFVFFICMALSFIALPYGPVAGLIVGFFGDFIFQRIREEKKLREEVLNPSGQLHDEPFPGCGYVCALGVYCCGDADSAVMAARSVFGARYDADWNMLCRAALTDEGVNGDLLTECVASILLKASAAKNTAVPIKEIFEFLRLTELNWNDDKMTERPSVYLGNLLDYRCTDAELEEAYKVLGLDADAGLDQVKKAHRKLAAAFHPDKTGSDGEFKKIQKAYELILKKS